jgi:putative Ca2+/H+ antiporter (TMEM165/GDT1 family)
VKLIAIVIGCVVGVCILAGLAVFIGRKVLERLAKDPMDELLEP